MKPVLLHCLRDWPADIAVDPQHPPMVEAADGGPPRVLTGLSAGGRALYCSLPPSRPAEGSAKARRGARKVYGQGLAPLSCPGSPGRQGPPSPLRIMAPGSTNVSVVLPSSTVSRTVSPSPMRGAVSVPGPSSPSR